MTDCLSFDPPWYTTPRIIIQRPFEFFPTRGMEPQEHLNAVVRFIIYVSIATALYRNMATPLLFGCVCIIVVSLLYHVTESYMFASVEERHRENRRGKRRRCTTPTHENPFMNVLPHEFGKDKPSACPQTPCITRKIDDHFDHHVIRELTDVYKKRASDRQFVTMPVTGNGTPNTLAFRNFLFSEVAKGTRCK